MNKNKLHSFVLNQLTEDTEIKEVIDWIESSPKHKEEFETLKNFWAISEFNNTPINRKYSRINNKKHFAIRVLKYAAIFIFAFFISGLSYFYYDNNIRNANDDLLCNEIIVPEGESAEIYLSDSTHVWLNSNSRLIYPSRFDTKKRDVKLYGEAYFEVAHNPQKPFHVITTNLAVAVKGTSFNVQAYDNEDNINVTLVEGKVDLKSLSGNVISKLLPGQNASLNLSTKKMKISNVNTQYFTTWKDGYLVFKEESLGDIANMLERWYNVSVIFNDESIKNLTFTGKILKNKPLDQVLDILKYMAKIDYSIDSQNDKPNVIYLKTMPM